MTKQPIRCALVLGAASLGAWTLAAFPTHTFDTNAQGWRYAGGGDYNPPGGPSAAAGDCPWDLRGNPGGALALADNQYMTFASAPAAFLGNQSDMIGNALVYDILVRYTDSANYVSAGISGGGLVLAYIDTFPAVGQWVTRTLWFEASHWRVGTTSGPVATDAQLRTVMSNLDGLFLLAEWHTGGDDTSIDNVRPLSSATIQGVVDLDMYDLDEGEIVRLEFMAPGSSTPIASGDVTLNAAGAFTMASPVAAGTYDVYAQGRHWLRQRVPGVSVTASGASGLAFTLINGDCDGSNRVDLDDFLLLASTYESAPLIDDRGDLTGDGACNLDDFLILAAAYEVDGD